MVQSKPRVLYIVYWGAAEPLGQSLVLPAVKKLADLGAELTLVTFEKRADLERRTGIDEVRASLSQHRVRWIPLTYHKRPKVPATFFDMLNGIARGIVEGLRSRPDIVHARTFIGGLIGVTLAPMLGAKFIYHNEGFYPDEQVDAGVWAMNSFPHRIAKWLENKMYSRANGIIAMSHRGKAVIEALSEVKRRRTPVIVVPSCVDLDLFRPKPPTVGSNGDAVRLVYIGSVGGRYILDKVGEFVAMAARELGKVHLTVLTKSDPQLVASMLRAGGLADGAWSVAGIPYSQMPERLAEYDAGLCFLTQGISEHGCSPTKIGEYWATGLPIVTTSNVSDTDAIIRSERVGVIVNQHSDEGYRRAAVELRALMQDPEAGWRCRRAAETHYALELACERQLALYQYLTSHALLEAAHPNASEFSKL
jgi:glycosyltransferase involved in cell wall biosynthesis